MNGYSREHPLAGLVVWRQVLVSNRSSFSRSRLLRSTHHSSRRLTHGRISNRHRRPLHKLQTHLTIWAKATNRHSLPQRKPRTHGNINNKPANSNITTPKTIHPSTNTPHSHSTASNQRLSNSKPHPNARQQCLTYSCRKLARAHRHHPLHQAPRGYPSPAMRTRSRAQRPRKQRPS